MKEIIYLLLAALALGAIAGRVPQRARAMFSRLGEKWGRLHPDMQRRALNAIDALAQDGVLVGIPDSGGWRSIEEQNALGGGVTQVAGMQSHHAWGLAVDLVPINNAGNFHWPSANDEVWKKIGKAVRDAGLIWGGDWDNDGVSVLNDPDSSFFDGPHAQYPVSVYAVIERWGNPDEFRVATHDNMEVAIV